MLFLFLKAYAKRKYASASITIYYFKELIGFN